MATWSRSQSQDAGGVRAVSSGSIKVKVSSSHDLVRCEKIRLANKRENARIARWAEEASTYKKVRRYNDTIEVKLSRKVKRKVKGLSAAKREALKMRHAARKAFFAELGVSL